MLIRIFAAIFLLLSSTVGYSKTMIRDIPREVLIEFNEPSYKDKYQSIVENAIKYAEDNSPNIKNKHIRIRVFIGKDAGSSKYSRYNKEMCDIKIANPDETSNDFPSFANELEIITLHELGHCALDKTFPFDKEITWKIELTKEEKETYLRLANEKQDLINFKECEPNCSGKDLSWNVHIAYAELFSDLFAANYYFKKNNEDILLFFVNFRYANYTKDGKGLNYYSHKLISEFMNRGEYPSLTYEEIIIASQKAILNDIRSR